ncbi:MAG TPA: hypothetical protein VK802_05805 [Streptosporangiaceae bacterium]|nr:hypothetical protein [Streptosporangiaceae bacterium]
MLEGSLRRGQAPDTLVARAPLGLLASAVLALVLLDNFAGQPTAF